MTKLICSKVSYNPYKEEFVTEITEKVFQVDGYHIADRLLEGVMFNVYFDDSGNVLEVKVDDSAKKYFEDNFNSEKIYKSIENYAKEMILLNGDEVEVPSFIKDKYFKNGINNAGIVIE